MSVLDASAVLALIHGEPGADVVARALPGAVLGTPNLAEVVGKLVEAGVPAASLSDRLLVAGVVLEPMTAADAVLAGALRDVDGGRALSLGDRCCLSVALRADQGVVLTADRAWADLDLPLEVHLLR